MRERKRAVSQWTRFKWVMSHIWMSHVTPMNTPRHTYWGVAVHIWMRHVTHMQTFGENANAPLDNARVMSHKWMSHVLHSITYMNASHHVYAGIRGDITNAPRVNGRNLNESCRTRDWVMSLIWIRHVTHTAALGYTYGSSMSHIWIRHVTHMNTSCHTCECVMSHIWMRHITHMNASCHTYEGVMSHTWRRHVTHMNASCHTYEFMWFNTYAARHTYAGNWGENTNAPWVNGREGCTGSRFNGPRKSSYLICCSSCVAVHVLQPMCCSLYSSSNVHAPNLLQLVCCSSCVVTHVSQLISVLESLHT